MRVSEIRILPIDEARELEDIPRPTVNDAAPPADEGTTDGTQPITDDTVDDANQVSILPIPEEALNRPSS